MWYSTIYRDVPLPNSTPLAAAFSVTSCRMEDLYIDSNALSRAEVDGGGGAMDTTGTNWLARGMWNQHVESGCWVSGVGGTVEDSRFTSIWADGCNINNVSLNASVGINLTERNNFFRGTGDDGLAINSVDYNTNSDGSNTYYTAMSNAIVTNNTVIAPWGGKGIALYGGSGHHVQNNYISDTARFIGLGIGRFGVNGSDVHTSTVSNNVVVRSGGNAYNQGQPAMQVGNGGDDLGWNGGGQWFRYTVNVATTGTYTVSFMVASPSGVTDAFHLANSTGTNLSGSVNIPATGGWETWTTVTATVTLPAGQQVLTLNEDNGGFNFYDAVFAK